jgi:hypothetical protein
MSENKTKELDLDALEIKLREESQPLTLRIKRKDGIALIQRLREAEAEIKRITFTAQVNWDLAQVQRLRAETLEHSIAQLERVREAATQFIEMVDRVNERPRREGVEMRAIAAQGALRAALEL